MNILIADDDVSTRISLCIVAEKWGYSVTSASDGLEALRILQNPSVSAPQLLVLDWTMPGMDGIDVCRQIRRNPQTKAAYIIMLTSRSEKTELVQALEAGADDYLTKPFSPDELRARLQTGKRIIELQASLASQIVELKDNITTLHKTELALNETKEYRNLFKHTNDPIIIFDSSDQKVLNVNDKACEIYDIDRAKFIGMRLDDIVPEQLKHEEMINLVIQKGKAEDFEIVHLRSDNTPMHLLINSSFIEFNGRKAILSINRDITDRHEVEQMVERALQEWSDTVDAVSDLIILTDAKNKIRRCNQATAIFFNQDYSELIGQSLNEICGFSTAIEVVASDKESKTDNPATLLKGKIWEVQITDRPGEWFEITNHYVSLTKSNQSGEHWVHIIKNITERKNTEESLTLLNTAVEQAADSIIVTDTDGIVRYVNPAFVNCTGWNRSEATGKKMIDLHAAELKNVLEDEKATFTLPNKVWQGIYRARKKTGENYDEEISISPVIDGNDSSIFNYVAVCRDVTEKRRLESIAEAVNMMQNVGYVFSGIRHELGNPINSVKTALTVLKKNLTKWDTAQVKIYIDRCLTETERVEYLLRALKTFSMHENPKIEPVLLTAFMTNFISLVEGDFNKRGVEIRLSSQIEIGEALCDPRALHQVLLNLITNAADALEDREEPLITISLAKDSKRIYVCIEDNGCGMNDQQVENLFKPFYTSKTSGTGLGLVIVKKMVTRMNGTIHIESVPEFGSKVHFTLETAS